MPMSEGVPVVFDNKDVQIILLSDLASEVREDVTKRVWIVFGMVLFGRAKAKSTSAR